jgi:hypothetical protein
VSAVWGTPRVAPPVLRRLVSRVRDARATVGIAGLARVAPRWLIQREFLVTVKDLTGPLPPITPRPDVSWRRLIEVEIPQLVASSPTLSVTEVRRRLGEGQECWVGWTGGAPAHWRWETREEAYLPYLHRAVRPLPGDLWVVEVYTHRLRRRQGLYTAATVLAMHRARQQGHSRLIGLIAGWNAPARRVAEVKLERSVVGTVGYWALGPWRLSFVRGNVRLDERGRAFIPHRSAPVAPGR